MTKEDLLRINGSGLFFFKSNLSDEKKLSILNWYQSLPECYKEYVDILRKESSDEEQFFHQEEN